MYEFSVEAQLSAEAEEVWAVVTDVAGWPAWDPHEKAARLDGPFEPFAEGKLRCVKTVQVFGPLVPLFRLYFGRRMRADMHKTFAALERKAARRRAAVAP